MPSSSAPWSTTLTTAGIATLLANMKKEAEFQEDHKDMNLAPDSGPPELSIREPRGEVRGNVAWSRLTVDSTAAVPNGAVAEIEWARIVPAKDKSLNPKRDWRNGEPADAPLTLQWSGLPATIPIHGVFEPGRYAVRVKIQGTQLDSHWQEFTVAPKSPWGTVKEVPRGLEGIGAKPQWNKAPAMAPSAPEQPATMKTPASVSRQQHSDFQVP